MPFDNDTLVFKVMGKMFMLLGLERWERGEPSINVKCDPQIAMELREQYDGVVTGAWHMSKTHWNTIYIESNYGRYQRVLNGSTIVMILWLQG